MELCKIKWRGSFGDENKKRRENADRKAADIEVKIYAGRAVHGNRGCADYVICGIAGILFALWGLLWKTTIDGKTIKVNPVIGKKKVVPFSDLKKAVVYKKKKTGSIVSYELIDKNNQSIVTIYPLMKDSSTLMERLKRLKYPVEEA